VCHGVWLFVNRYFQYLTHSFGQRVWPGVSLLLTILIVLLTVSAHANSPASFTLSLAIASTDNTDIAQISAQKFIQIANQQNFSIDFKSPVNQQPKVSTGRGSDLIVMPLHTLAQQVPALEVLELPFFYSNLKQIHNQLDGKLGQHLTQQARKQGWVVLGWWDEGMQVFSGNRRYNQRINLSGMEFILLRDDPMAQLQFKSFNAWSRRVTPQSSKQLLKECAVGSRSASLQRIWSERLDRVHLSLSLTQHRYEGWVLVAHLTRWQKFSVTARQQLQKQANEMRDWQRLQAQSREQVALKKLKQNNMQIFKLSPERHQEFVQRLPGWAELLPASLSADEKQDLLIAATTGI
jgi:TRAP-type C4-dicarboxylate transport system substrate-binding protein